MTAEIGQYALILALMVSAVGGVLTLAGAELASRSWMRVGMAPILRSRGITSSRLCGVHTKAQSSFG